MRQTFSFSSFLVPKQSLGTRTTEFSRYTRGKEESRSTDEAQTAGASSARLFEPQVLDKVNRFLSQIGACEFG